jgi:hypothetical protein
MYPLGCSPQSVQLISTQLVVLFVRINFLFIIFIINDIFIIVVVIIMIMNAIIIINIGINSTPLIEPKDMAYGEALMWQEKGNRWWLGRKSPCQKIKEVWD